MSITSGLLGLGSSVLYHKKKVSEIDSINAATIQETEQLCALLQGDKEIHNKFNKIKFARQILASIKHGENPLAINDVVDKIADSYKMDQAFLDSEIQRMSELRLNKRQYFNQLYVFRNLLYDDTVWDPSFITINGLITMKGFLPRFDLELVYVSKFDKYSAYPYAKANITSSSHDYQLANDRQLAVVKKADVAHLLVNEKIEGYIEKPTRIRNSFLLVHTKNEEFPFADGITAFKEYTILDGIHASPTSVTVTRFRKNIFLIPMSIDRSTPFFLSLIPKDNVLSFAILSNLSSTEDASSLLKDGTDDPIVMDYRWFY